LTTPLDNGVATVLEQIVTDTAHAGRLPGVVAAVFLHGDLWWRGAVGDVREQYRVGSITKTFTAVAVLQLRDEGRLELDDLVAAHLPESPYGRSTIRSLLSHSSGMTAEPAGDWWERSPGSTWSQLVAANAGGRMVFAPHSRYHYSNLGFAILGQVVARRRAATWWEAVSASVIEPLGLRETTYAPRDDAAIGTSRDPLTGRLMAEPAQDTAAMAPAGQLWSTAADLGRWADFLATGHPQVLSRSSLVEMRTVQSGDPDEQHRGGHGLGLRLRWLPQGSLIGHTGSMPGFLAAVFVDPTSRVGGVVLTNATVGVDTETVVDRLVRTVAPGLAGVVPEPAALSETTGSGRSGAADELGGDWYFGNTALSLTPTAGGFVLQAPGGPRRFDHVGADRFCGRDGYYAGEDLQVVRRDDGSVAYLEVVTFVLTRRPYDPDAPIPGGLPEALPSPR
jgi:CubicO group peptidase (beta-lactamase class C family)